MAASASDLFTNTASTTTARPQPTQVTSSRSAGVFTLSCNALTGWPTDSAVEFCTYKLNTAGAKIAGSQIDMKGIVSGTTIGSISIRGGTDVGNTIGDIVEMAPTAAWAYDLYQGLMASHNRDGSLLTAAVQAALGLTSLNGYTPVGFTPNTVTYNGNRSYDLVFNSQDLTSFLSNGMRLRTTRTVAAPTQCTSLNGTTQYYSKTSPAGMTFTNNFVAGGWIKLSAYPSSEGNVISRYNGTSGWECKIDSSGRVRLTGHNAAAANFSEVLTYQSLPLNKWVHISAQLDMATFTASPTTSYVMIDGVDVPCSVSRGGTNPTALVQAGNLEVGSTNSGTNLLTGKIAQAFVTSAKVTQATIRSNYINQSISPTETNLISAYSFNNSINDLNTTSANNLTANGSAVATTVDSPFTQDDTGTPGGSNDYAIITKKAFSTNTTITVQVPEGCTIPTSGGVSSVVYSSNKTPYGFPSQTSRWNVLSLTVSQQSQGSAANATWYNVGSMQINTPAGEWELGYSISPVVTGTGQLNLVATLSTASNTSSDIEYTAETGIASPTYAQGTFTRVRSRGLSSATVYFLNLRAPIGSSLTIYNMNNAVSEPVIIEAKLAYL